MPDPGRPEDRSVLVRARRAEDIASCAALVQLTHELDGYPRHLPADPASFVVSSAELGAWVAEQRGEVLGHVALHRADGDPTVDLAGQATSLGPERLAVVARLMVHPRLREHGAGRALLQTATDQAAQHHRRAVLDVRKGSVATIALYERWGWRRLGSTVLPVRGHDPLDLWVYLSPDPELHLAPGRP